MRILNNGAVEIARGKRASDGATYVLAMRPGGVGSRYVTWRVEPLTVGQDDDGEELVIAEGYDHGYYFLDIFEAAQSFNIHLGIPCRVISDEMTKLARRFLDEEVGGEVKDGYALALKVMERGS